MYFQSFKEFIEMGGHGLYVWLCYSIVLSVLIVYFIYSKRSIKNKQKELMKFYQRMDSRHSSNPQRNIPEEN